MNIQYMSIFDHWGSSFPVNARSITRDILCLIVSDLDKLIIIKRIPGRILPWWWWGNEPTAIEEFIILNVFINISTYRRKEIYALWYDIWYMPSVYDKTSAIIFPMWQYLSHRWRIRLVHRCVFSSCQFYTYPSGLFNWRRYIIKIGPLSASARNNPDKDG